MQQIKHYLCKMSIRRQASVQFHDFKWFSERNTVSVTVHGEELHKLYKAIAKCNGVAVGKLMANSKIVAGKQLKCIEIHNKPPGWSWLPDTRYLHPKLKHSKVPSGHSHFGDGAKSGDGDGGVRHRSRKRLAPSSPAGDASQHSTPQRAKRPRSGPPRWLDDFSCSPGSPTTEDAGLTQPVPIRLHLAAHKATYHQPEAANGLQIRHICGNSKCGVVSHFRIGTFEENERDKHHHREHGPGSSWQSFPPPQ